MPNTTYAYNDDKLRKKQERSADFLDTEVFFSFYSSSSSYSSNLTDSRYKDLQPPASIY